MSEEQQKNLRLLIYWSFSTVTIVFAAITSYIVLWTRPIGMSLVGAIGLGFPIWGVTAAAAAVLVGGYYLYTSRQSANISSTD